MKSFGSFLKFVKALEHDRELVRTALLDLQRAQHELEMIKTQGELMVHLAVHGNESEKQAVLDVLNGVER